VKETVISASENVRVVRLGNVRYDWRVEKLVRDLLKTLDAKDMAEWKLRKGKALFYAEELGWHRNNLGNWERE
jgi:hypothetical protein